MSRTHDTARSNRGSRTGVDVSAAAQSLEAVIAQTTPEEVMARTAAVIDQLSSGEELDKEIGQSREALEDFDKAVPEQSSVTSIHHSMINELSSDVETLEIRIGELSADIDKRFEAIELSLKQLTFQVTESVTTATKAKVESQSAKDDVKTAMDDVRHTLEVIQSQLSILTAKAHTKAGKQRDSDEEHIVSPYKGAVDHPLVDLGITDDDYDPIASGMRFFQDNEPTKSDETDSLFLDQLKAFPANRSESGPVASTSKIAVKTEEDIYNELFA